ncbi:MAG: NADPH-dependent 2,4-dienoyl-CoA reductase, partial [Allobranchiibius sp.]
ITDAVHEAGGRIALQILHAGRYGYHPLVKSASALKSPISKFAPRAMSGRDVERTIDHYARAARLAMRAGYDGIEIMGSEGYLINQFLAARTNERADKWGGSASNRMRFPEQVVSRVRESVGAGFPLIYRQSLMDLVTDGQDWDETVELAQRIEAAGASVINTGIGWHEARIPTIVTSVPRAAFASVTGALRGHVDIPVMASNRINTPEIAEQILADEQADMISMARPLLADPDFVVKTQQGRADEINTCIACNQACLDHTFANKRASCLVNPRAGRETTLQLLPVAPHAAKTIAVVGAGPAGLAAAVASAERGHRVTLFEQQDEIGGQFRYAMRIPGKEEFAETLRYYTRRLEILGVEVCTGTTVDEARLASFDHAIIATGVTPRSPSIEGIDHPSVVMYDDLLSGRASAGPRVAVIGAGGIGFDVSEFLLHDSDETLQHWKARWGVVDPQDARAGLGVKQGETPQRTIYLMQRKPAPLGKGLGKTSGWVHRATLKDGGVELIGGVTYDRIDDEGLHIILESGPRLLQVDTIVIAAGQESVRTLAFESDPKRHLVGGADVAAEVDAKRAIRQATELAATL